MSIDSPLSKQIVDVGGFAYAFAEVKYDLEFECDLNAIFDDLLTVVQVNALHNLSCLTQKSKSNCKARSEKLALTIEVCFSQPNSTCVFKRMEDYRL